jgi:hypothetical protein
MHIQTRGSSSPSKVPSSTLASSTLASSTTSLIWLRACVSRDGCRGAVPRLGGNVSDRARRQRRTSEGGGPASGSHLRSRALSQPRQGLNVDHLTDADWQVPPRCQRQR